MVGMKIRCTKVKNLASIEAKGAVCAILLLLLAFAFPGLDYAQDKPVDSKVSLQNPNSANSQKSADAGSSTKGTIGGNRTETSAAGAITDVKISPDNGHLTVAVSTDRAIVPKEIILDNPPRLVLDFPNTENRVKFSKLQVSSPSVKQVRVQQFQNAPSPIARIVCDLEKNYGAHELNLDKASVSLIFNDTAPAPIAGTEGPSTKPPAKAQTGGKTVEPEAQARIIPPAQPKVDRDPVSVPVELTARLSPAPVPLIAARLDRTPVQLESSRSVMPEHKPKAAEPAQKALAAPVPLMAASMPVSLVTQSRQVPASSSRYTGQPLTLDLVEMPLVDFFRLMAEEGGINVVVDPDVKGTISIKAEKLPWDQVFDMALSTRGLDKEVEGNLIRITRKATLQEEAKQREALKKANLLASDVETRIRRLNYAKAQPLINILADQKTVRGTIVVDERTNSLILSDIPQSLDSILNLIDVLDTPQPQVEIEARIVSATRDFARDIGVQFGFVAGNLQRVTVGGPNTYGTIGGSRPSTTPTSTYVAGNESTGRGASESKSSESGGVSPGGRGNWNVNLPAAAAFGGLGLSIGNIFDTFLLDAAITAGESKGLAKLISQPKVTAQNNNVATITQGVRFPVQIVANNTVTVQFQNAALTLTVTPQITYEGNIVLDMKVENNTPDWAHTVDNIPSIRTSESATRVLVSDGGTTVIGGILIDADSTVKEQIPGLGSLPVVGHLFRRDFVSRSTQEVLFFVTPRIVK
jgi:type IV pilus assembly protein PilQ